MKNTRISVSVLSITILFAAGCKKDEVLNNTGNSPVVESKWERLNSAPSVTANCFLSKGDTIFVGTVSGLFASVDSGRIWRGMGSGTIATAPTFSLIPSGNKLFAGTGIRRGLYGSTDNGTLWYLANNGLPNSSPISLIEKGYMLFAGMADSGVYVSIDSGANWQSANSEIFMAGTDVRGFAISGDKLFAATFGSGVFVSSDNGGHWAGATGGLCLSILVMGNDLFVGTVFGGRRSTDGGRVWSTSIAGLPSGRINALTANSNYWFAGADSGVYLSSNSGATWTPVSQGLPEPPLVNAITFFKDYVLLGTAVNGLWRSKLDSLIRSLR